MKAHEGGEMPLDERKLEVLKAIIEDYVSTQEPVGSKMLAERHGLRVSSATIRNDMAVLEDEGYLIQPHTSAGRIPTDKGYRLFVDRLSTIKPLSVAERRAINQFLEGAIDLDDIVHRTVRLLAQLTRQVAVVQYPSLTRSKVRHLELVPLLATRLMLVLITDTGRVEQRVVEFPSSLTEEHVVDLRSRLNSVLAGVHLGDTADLIEHLVTQTPPWLRPQMITLSSVLLETLVEHHEERIVLSGTANLTRNELDFPGSIRPILEALEEQMVLLKLIGEVDQSNLATVRIGDETQVDQLRGTSVVAAGYGAGNTVYAGLGVLGPVRMDYPGTISAVRAVARYVGEYLSK
jgi:heat-inducible transcriptional repressor